MESLKRSIRYQFMESKSFILGLWGTTLIVNIFFYILNNLDSINFNIGLSMGTSAEGITPISVTGINLMIILISLLVYNFERNYESFPLAISLSMTRKEYFVSFLIDNIYIAFVFATIQGVLMKIDPYLVKLVGKVPVYDFLYFNTKTDNVFYIIFILFVVFLGFICFWSLIASLNYKFGYIIWIIAVVFNMGISILNIKIFGNLLKSIGNMFNSRLGTSQFIIIFLGISVSYMLNYIIVKTTNIKLRRS